MIQGNEIFTIEEGDSSIDITIINESQFPKKEKKITVQKEKNG